MPHCGGNPWFCDGDTEFDATRKAPTLEMTRQVRKHVIYMMVSWLSNLRNYGVAARLTMLVAVVLVAFALASPVAIHLGGMMALKAATLAAGLCLLGSATALVVADRLRGPNAALVALFAGMATRTGVPFVAVLAIHLHGGPLAQAGLLWYLLVFYPIALAVGTILSLPPTNQRPTPAP